MFEGLKKAFGYVEETKGIALTDPAAREIFSGLPNKSGAVVTSHTAIQVPAVLQAVRVIAENVGSIPCKLYSNADETKETAKDHPAYGLVHGRSNAFTSAGQLREELTTDALLHGAGYAQVIRVGDDRPYALKRLPPASVQRRFNDNDEPVYLVTDARGRQHRLSYRDVLFVPSFASMSLVQAGKNAIGLAMVLERHGERFFADGARPSGLITDESKITDTQGGANKLANILGAWQRWSKSETGDPLVLDRGQKYVPLTMHSTDAQFIENRVEQTNEIARVFGVPPHLLFQLDRATWSNAEQMAATFLQLCLRRWLDRWQDAYATVLLTEAEQRSHYAEFVTADLERADALGRADIYSKLIAARVYTPNEVRARENLPPLPGGDELANPYTTTTTTGPATVPTKDAA